MKQLRERSDGVATGWREEAMRLRAAAGRGRAYIALLRDRVAKSDPEAMWWLASAYDDGLTDADGAHLVARNPRKAVELYRRGAQLGNLDCMVNLAHHLSSGVGIHRDLREAIRWERRAGQRGSAVAASNAGVSHKQRGEYRAAVRWFRKAAELGDEGAWLEIAKAELLGQGTRRNVQEAMVLLRRTAESDDVAPIEAEQASLLLAFVHLDGWLVARSFSEGSRWLHRAEKKGSIIAREIARSFTLNGRQRPGRTSLRARERSKPKKKP